MSAAPGRLIDEIVMVQQTGHRHVGILPSAYADFMAAETRWRRLLERRFEHFGIRNTTLPKEHFRSEGFHSVGVAGVADVQVFAFKAKQHRLYGIITNHDGSELFVGVCLQIKKTEKANQEVLRRTAKVYGSYLD